MKKLLFCFLLFATPAFAQFADPCVSQAVTKQTVSISISTATTTQLVALVTGKTIYVCSFSFTAATGTGATYQFEYGTGTTCGTGTTALTGTMAGAGNPLFSAGFGTNFSTPSANALCLITGGTSPNAQGYLSYVQY